MSTPESELYAYTEMIKDVKYWSSLGDSLNINSGYHNMEICTFEDNQSTIAMIGNKSTQQAFWHFISENLLLAISYRRVTTLIERFQQMDYSTKHEHS